LADFKSLVLNRLQPEHTINIIINIAASRFIFCFNYDEFVKNRIHQLQRPLKMRNKNRR